MEFWDSLSGNWKEIAAVAGYAAFKHWLGKKRRILMGEEQVQVEKVELKAQGVKETHDVYAGSAKLIGAIKGALKDGWQPGMDIPVVVMASVQELGAIVSGLEKIPAEHAQALPEALQTHGHGAGLIAAAIAR